MVALFREWADEASKKNKEKRRSKARENRSSFVRGEVSNKPRREELSPFPDSPNPWGDPYYDPSWSNYRESRQAAPKSRDETGNAILAQAIQDMVSRRGQPAAPDQGMTDFIRQMQETNLSRFNPSSSGQSGLSVFDKLRGITPEQREAYNIESQAPRSELRKRYKRYGDPRREEMENSMAQAQSQAMPDLSFGLKPLATNIWAKLAQIAELFRT